MFGIVALLGVSFVVVLLEQARYQKAVESRNTSIQLAEELRQSSSDLARLVRTYVITGNREYKDQFNAVVEIRDGKRARPRNYSVAYWDFQIIDTQLGSGGAENHGEAIALVDLMRNAGVTDAELENLKKSKEKSDELVEIENKAMALIEEDVPTLPEKRDQALYMLADSNFLKMKAEIMRPIIETEYMIIQRTQNAVNIANNRLNFSTTCLFLLIGMLILLIYKIGQELKSVIGCSVQELSDTLNNIGNGDFMNPIVVDEDKKNSVLGWIASTSQKLAELNLSHSKAIIDSSDDAIVSKNMNGIVASWNSGAEKIFGYTASEMIGKPLTYIIPNERLHEEQEILVRIAQGEKVDHFETQRLHRDGGLVDLSVTISPIYGKNGDVIGASKIARDISKAKTAEMEIHRLAFYDSLTGLANRSLLNERLNSTLKRAERGNSVFALLFIDLDNFKVLNDTYGHDLGDELLKLVSMRLRNAVRETDTVARFGGDEFVILLEKGTTDSEGQDCWLDSLICKLIHHIAQPYQLTQTIHTCSASIGAVIFENESATACQILKNADRAMYKAKFSGKNTYHIYSGNS
jgi:diguanylate cyclase (GGDEF)-like protein/PAS domain S-box-containing protein